MILFQILWYPIQINKKQPKEKMVAFGKKYMHSVGFEPTRTNTFELESNPLDRSGKNAKFP